MKLAIIVEQRPDAQRWLDEALALAFPGLQTLHAATVSEGLALLANHRPDICLVSLPLADGTGTDFIRHCRQHHPHCHQVATSLFDEDAQIFPALKAGANGYLFKEEDQNALARALRRLTAQQAPPSDTTPSLVSCIHYADLTAARHKRKEGNLARLTDRQKVILRGVAEGMTTQDIADALEISVHTTRQHVKNIYERLQVHSRAQATRLAMESGLLGG